MGIFVWADIVSGAIKLANKAADYFAKKDDQNTGRKLQTADELAASLKGDIRAQETSENSDGLTRDQLIDRLRQPAAGDK